MEHLLLINQILQSAMIYLVGHFVVRFVFMENELGEKVRLIYHSVAILLILVSCFLFDASVSSALVLVLIAVRIIIARESELFKGFLLIFPVAGIIDGLLLPILVLPGNIIGLDENKNAAYQLGVYGLIILVFLGISWYSQFSFKKMRSLYGDRLLAKWERMLLCVVGIIQLIFSLLIDRPLNTITGGGELANANVYLFIILLGISSFVMTIIVIIVVLVGNKQNYYHNKVSNMQYNMIVMMAEIVENRDKDTGGHIRRTAKYVEIITNHLRKTDKYKNVITDSFVKDIKVAAPLHDIGKIHIPDSILNKPGRLTDEEFAIMKTHAEEGRKLLVHAKKHLGEFTYLDMAIDMAGDHHEWWDGSAKGYPNQLKGEEIPLSARIMAVADVFDALTARRCYKDPMPFEKALNIMKDENGTHFDPDVIAAFFEGHLEIREELKRFDSEADKHCHLE